jgi:hypothetical protein
LQHCKVAGSTWSLIMVVWVCVVGGRLPDEALGIFSYLPSASWDAVVQLHPWGVLVHG